jgi:glyoxylase-like metal-dependent hydrolase (beta-lactamase superfamily II)
MSGAAQNLVAGALPGRERNQIASPSTMSMQLGQWRLDSIRGGDLWLDGGVVFGVVPKTLWAKVMPPDENNRIRISTNCVLARNGQHTVLIDTGYGSKFPPLDRRFYGLESGNPVLESLAAHRVAPDDVDLVVFSHLHFDHAGGATWLDDRRTLMPTFPRARHIIGRLEWEDATSGAPELQTAYNMDNLAPLANAGLVELIEGNAEIVPGLRARHTGGHTRGHLALVFESEGQTALLIGDVCASSAHLHPMWNLSYDTFPLDTRRVKPQLLADAARGNWWVIWPHDPQVAVARIEIHPKRGFIMVDPRPSL